MVLTRGLRPRIGLYVYEEIGMYVHKNRGHRCMGIRRYRVLDKGENVYMREEIWM